MQQWTINVITNNPLKSSHSSDIRIETNFSKDIDKCFFTNIKLNGVICFKHWQFNNVFY